MGNTVVFVDCSGTIGEVADHFVMDLAESGNMFDENIYVMNGARPAPAKHRHHWAWTMKNASGVAVNVGFSFEDFQATAKQEARATIHYGSGDCDGSQTEMRESALKTEDSMTPGRELQARIDKAIATGQPATVSIPPGGFSFSGESLQIAGAHTLRIVAAARSTTLWFDCGFGVHIANSTGVTFRGFTQDYSVPCHAQGTVVAVSNDMPRSAAQWADVKFDLGHFLNPSNQTLFPRVDGSVPFDLLESSGTDLAAPTKHISVKMAFWDAGTTRMIAHGNHLVNNSTRIGEDVSTFRIHFTGPLKPDGTVQAGALATVHFRLGLADPTTLKPLVTGSPGGLTYLITNSSNVSTLNHTLHGGGTEAIVEAGGEGGHTYRGVRVVRRPDAKPMRLLAANADGFHSSCVRRGPTLEDSEFSWTGDDLLNIHSRISIVLQVLSATSAYIIDAEGVSAPGDSDESTLMFERAHAGDELAFFALGTLKPKGSNTSQNQSPEASSRRDRGSEG